MKESGFDKGIVRNEMFLRRIFGSSESLLRFDTYQFDDYSKIDQNRFDEEKKAASISETAEASLARIGDFESPSCLGHGMFIPLLQGATTRDDWLYTVTRRKVKRLLLLLSEQE